MEFLERIVNPSIFVCSYSYKEAILKEISKRNLLLPIKFLTFDDLLKIYFFSYDERTIAYCMEKYNLKYEIALMYIRNLYFLKEENRQGPLKFLFDLKDELLSLDLLYFSNKDFLTKNDIYFLGFSYFSKIEEFVISELKKDTNVYFYDFLNPVFEPKVYEALNISLEVSFVILEICKLLDAGVALDKIKLVNLDSDYDFYLKELCTLHNIPISFPTSLYGLEIVADFLNLYDEYSLEEAIASLEEKYPKDQDLINKIISICNNYALIEDKAIKKEFLVNSFKHIKLKTADSSIAVISLLDDYIAADDYVFLLNFNQNAIPKMQKDEDYITDIFKRGQLLDLTVDLNKKIKEATLNKIKSIKNLVITYKLATPFRTFYPSSLKEFLTPAVAIDLDYQNSYSLTFTKLELAKKLDYFLKYGAKDASLELLNSNISSINYQDYDNKYKLLTYDLVETKSYNLSYSSMDNYYKCPFRYYLANILNLDIFEDNFAAYLGSLFHYVLQFNIKDNIDIDTLISRFIKEHQELNAKETFFIRNLRKELEFILATIKEQYQETELTSALYEKRMLIPLNKDASICFKGFIDKILYKKEQNRTVVAVIDYKTGNTSIDLSLCPLGLNMQLPIYLYLVKKSDCFSKVKFAGFYLQKILSDIPTIDLKKSFLEQKKDALKLIGYSNSDEDILHTFDNSYKDSRLIKGLNVKKDGTFGAYAKVLSDDSFDKLTSKAEEKINEAICKIEKKCFEIAPKRVNDVNISCTFCKFRDICFRKEDDILDVAKDDKLTFLGGEVDA